jgi:O-antigen/teichoic acid export membrane protein
MSLIFIMFSIVAVRIAWKQGVRDPVSLAIAVIVGPVLGLTLFGGFVDAVGPFAPLLLLLVVVAASVVGWLRYRGQRVRFRDTTTLTSTKRRIDRG